MKKPTKRKAVDSGRLKNGSRTTNTRSRAETSEARKKTVHGKGTQQLGKRQNGHAQSSRVSPSVWTKSSSSSSKKNSAPRTVLSTIGHGIVSVFRFIGHFFLFVFSALLRLAKKSRVAAVIMLMIVVIGAVWIVDTGFTWNKIYQGVHIGEIDVGGMTEEEAKSIIEATYAPRLNEKEIRIYSSEEASADYEAALAQSQGDAVEELSYEDAVANRVLWTTDAHILQAKLNSDDLIQEALSLGREQGGLLARFDALISGFQIDPSAHYDVIELEALAQDIDATIGDPRINYGVTVNDGVASVVEGHDGYMVDRDVLQHELDDAFFRDDAAYANLIAHADYAPLQIDADEARRVSDRINTAITPGAVFSYGDATWSASAADLGAWVVTGVVDQDGGHSLVASLDHTRAKRALISHLDTGLNVDTLAVTFEHRDGTIYVKTDTNEPIPLTESAVRDLEAKLFGGNKADDEATYVTVEKGVVPDELTFDDALDDGIVEEIATYTTQYYAWPTERQHNIHLASDLLNNSIIPSSGGTWSFNKTAGNCNEEAGFLASGAIINNEYTDDIGGGICQVATTVFNAVYEAGFPVLSRFNHTLYIASYPAGRDAAVSWPDLDLAWENDSTSDVVLIMSYTDTSITASLYGVDPGYQVSTNAGEWQEGEKHRTKTEVDESLAPETSYVKSVGADGRKISVVRTVNDSNGMLLHSDVFSSTYEPVTEIVVEGPKAEEAKNAEEDSTNEG